MPIRQHKVSNPRALDRLGWAAQKLGQSDPVGGTRSASLALVSGGHGRACCGILMTRISADTPCQHGVSSRADPNQHWALRSQKARPLGSFQAS